MSRLFPDQSLDRSENAFKMEALRYIEESLEEARTQHPLDLPQILSRDSAVPLVVPSQLYRSVRLFAFRETLGSKVSSIVLELAGRSIGKRLGIRNQDDLVRVLGEFGIKEVTVESAGDDRFLVSSSECATCAGLPDIGEAVCHFETGIIAGALEGMLGSPFRVVETKCWGLGDTVCAWEASRATISDRGDDPERLDTSELAMRLEGRVATSSDSSMSNRRLKKAYDELRECDQLKKDLTQMVVHDMRVPLTTIIGAVQTLGEISKSKLNKKEIELLEMALSGGQSLMCMINDLLDVSRLEEHQLNLTKKATQIESTIMEAVRCVEFMVGRKNLEFAVELPPHLPEVDADEVRLVRVLVNLLQNAVRHTPSGGRITVTAVHVTNLSVLQIGVCDTGEGIPKEYHDRIFDKFAQVESDQARRFSSCGLGLTFCKLVIEAHGGRIWVESEPGAGSNFHLTLPVQPAYCTSR